MGAVTAAVVFINVLVAAVVVRAAVNVEVRFQNSDFVVFNVVCSNKISGMVIVVAVVVVI